MIFSRKHNFIFIHNPKVGGTSIRKILEPFHDSSTKTWHQAWTPTENRVLDMAHLQASQWVDKDVASRFVFGFVRNPYERFWSSVKEFDRRHGDTIKLSLSNIWHLLTPANIQYDWRFIHFCPQHAFFYNGSDQVADFIGRQEHMDAGWAYVVSRLGLDQVMHKLPNERKSPDKSPVVDALMKDIPLVQTLVNRLYYRDFILFGYQMHGGFGFSDSHGDRIQLIHDPLLHPLLDEILSEDRPTPTFKFTAGEMKEIEKYKKRAHFQRLPPLEPKE